MKSLSFLPSDLLWSAASVDPWPSGHPGLSKFQLHRGLWVEGLPQNSLEAILVAEDRGAPMVEFDVRLSGDGIPVLSHDEILVADKKSDRPVVVGETPFQELQKDFGLSSLAEVLLKTQVLLNIEIKSESIETKTERKVAELILDLESRGISLQSRILFSSFHPLSLWKLKSYLPEVPRGLLVASQGESVLVWSRMGLCHALHLEESLLTEARTQMLSERGIPVAAWTVNEKERVQELKNWGIPSIITDRPEHLDS